MFGVLLWLAGLSAPDPSPILQIEIAHAEFRPEVISIDQLITDAAKRHHLNREHLYKTLEKESSGFGDITIQSHYITKDGTREQSFGICQINLPSWPDVSYEQAIDPVFCIEWTAQKWEEGHAELWSAYRELRDSGWK